MAAIAVMVALARPVNARIVTAKRKQEFTTNYDEDDYCEPCGA